MCVCVGGGGGGGRACRVCLATRRTDKAVSKGFTIESNKTTWIWRTPVFVLTDKWTDYDNKHDQSLYPSYMLTFNLYTGPSVTDATLITLAVARIVRGWG